MRLRLRPFLTAVALVFAAISSAQATPLTTPTGLNPGDTFRFAFVTNAVTTPESSDIAVYDSVVSNDASGYTYGGQQINVKAIASTPTVNARDHVGGFGTSVPVYLVNGVKVANDLTTNSGGLWFGSIENPVSLTLAGSSPSERSVWTGSSQTGLAFTG